MDLVVLSKLYLFLEWVVLVDKIAVSAVCHHYIEAGMICVPSESDKWVVEIRFEWELVVLHLLSLWLVVFGVSLFVHLDLLDWLQLGVLFHHAKHQQLLLRLSEYGLDLGSYFRLYQLTFFSFFFQILHFFL